ncbi:MAG TPA: ATP-binding protein [bacterium]|nr:ATP-binding protein [bacterium]
MPALAITDVFHQILHWTVMLSQGVDPSEIHNEMAASVPQWQEAPELRAPLAHISSLLPPRPDTMPPASGVVPVTRERLVQALDDTIRDLEVTTDDLQLRENIDSLRRRFARLKQGDGEAVSIAPPVLRVHGTREISGEIIAQQMADALRDALAKVTHDANNILTALTGEMTVAEETCQRVDFLARRHFHLIPGDVRVRLSGTLESMDRVLDGMSGVLMNVAQLVRGVQRVIASLRDVGAGADLERTRLASDGGLIAQITIGLFDLLTDAGRAEENLREMNLIADQYGHVASAEDLAEGLALLRDLSECFQTAKELTALTVDLFRLHQEFVLGLKNGGEGAADLHAHLNKRTLSAFMGRGVEVEFRLDGEPWRIPGPSIRVWQVILNNIVNARDAMGGSGRLSVSTRKVLLDEDDAARLSAPLIRGTHRAGDFMMLQVSDDGPGIPPHVLPRIFDPSFSGKNSTGLGLAVTLQIVQTMGGFIAVRTSTAPENHGTVFSIYFPRAEEAPPPPLRPLPETGREIVLVVDNEELILRTAKRVLMARGHGVLTASGGREAVDRAQEWYRDLSRPPISAVLLDINMPGVATRALLEKLRTVDPHMVCLFQSGIDGLPEDLQDVEMAGFLPKPASADELVGQMRFLLNRMRRNRPTLPAPPRLSPKGDGR